MRHKLPAMTTRAVAMTLLIAASLICAGSAFAQSQATAADLSGTVTDPNGAVVTGATVTARISATGISRSATSDSDGHYSLVNLPPGEYEVTAEAANFKKIVISGVRLTVGQAADLTLKLEIGTPSVVVNVSADDVQLVEPTRSSVTNTIDQQRIQNLPINQRDATGFALTLSTVGRDNGRPIGPAPTSGLNIGGQRGRSTQVNVDGADFTDNSINAARTTVSMEAVQEYQVATNSYTPEFGRATGGVINVVTKRGTNNVNGNVFGFIRDKSIQARNAFAPVAKPAFRRTQWGGTIGGPLVKDQAFLFGSFERRQRDESGFFTSDVVGPLTASATIGVIPGLNPVARTFTGLTAQQAGVINALVASGNPNNICAARAYAFFASSGAQTGLTGTNSLTSPNDGSGCPPISPIGPGAVGSRFLLSGTPVPVSDIAFRPLNTLQRVFPVTERTNFSSVRFDTNINNANQFNVRFGYNTSFVSGIQVESQNQSLGQNDFSRTGITHIKDTSFSSNLVSDLNSTMVNDLRFSFGRRKTSFLSQNGQAVADNIAGTAFLGRELFSPVDRTEVRYQFLDNLTWVHGSHTFKFGGDYNDVSIARAHFELNFAGLFNFGNFAAANLNPAFAGLPDLTPVQSYGLGLPSLYIQGFGNPDSKIGNKPISFFGQDSWKLTRRLTINYGVRYDVELSQTITPVGFRDPLTGITLSASDIQAAQDVMGVQQGVPRDKNNWQPRVGFAYDVFGTGRTVLRGNIGLYYDHPLLAIAFNSDIADAAQQQQAVLTAGSPAFVDPTTGKPVLLNAAQVFQGTVCTAASANPICPAGFSTPGAAATSQYQFGRQRFNDQTFTGFGPVLPFVLPVSKDFQYAEATQANFGIEHQIGKNMSISATYIFVGAHHLPHPTDLNTPNTALQIQNYIRCFGTNPVTTQDVSTVDPTKCNNIVAQPIPGIVSVTTRGGVIAPAIANFFRPNAPNYFLAFAASGGLVNKATLDAAIVGAGTLRTPGTLTPFGSVNAQISDGNSNYNAGLFEVKRRFANNFTFLASYTWSHSIDDSSDLQTLLIAQDVRNFRAERADSLFDQRHRFVFSGVLTSPDTWRQGDGWHRFLSNFTVAPIFEWSSGRPFNIITNTDTNNDQSTQTDRPSVNADGTLCVPGNPGCITPLITNGQFSTGNLPRNAGITHSFQSLDLRVSRALHLGERARIELIAEGFNLFNRFNEASASPFFTDVNAFHQRASNGRYYSRPTAAFDPRQFQFGAKLSF
jgi:hypothetical protein